MSILSRIRKYRLHYVIVIPGLLLILAFKLVPLLQGFILSLKDFQPSLGLRGSPWVGFDQYATLLSMEPFRNAIGNTIALKLAYIALSGALAFAIAAALNQIRSGGARGLFATLFLLPYFIPSVVIAQLTIVAFSQQSPILRLNAMPLGDSNLYPFVVLLAETIRTLGIPIVIALAAMRRSGGSRPVAALAAVAAFALLQLSALLSPDFELMHSLINPLVYNVGDTIDTFVFRIGYMNLNFGPAAAAQSVQFAVQFALALVGYVVVRSFLKRRLFGEAASHSTAVPSASAAGQAIGYAAATVYALPVLATLGLLFVYPFAAKSESGLSLTELLNVASFVRYALLYGFAVIVHMLMVATLSYPLTVRDLPGRSAYKLGLIAATVIGSGTVSEYVFYQGLGLTITVYPLMLTGMFGLAQVFVLKSIYNSRVEGQVDEGRGETHRLFYRYLPTVWKPLLALGALHFASLWNSFYVGFLHMTDAASSPPIIQFMSASWQGDIPPGDPLILAYGAMVSLPGIALLLLLRRWLTAEVFVGEVRKL